MAVDTTQSWQEHTSDGSTAYFPFNFNYDTTRPGTIVVGKRTADNTYSVVDASNYELIPNAAGDGGQIRFIQNPSGSQIIDDIPPAGTIVRIERVSVDTSSATWQIGLEMSELVNLFDRLFRLVQENKGGFDNVIKTFETQHNVSLYELLSAHNNHLLYWDNTTQTLTPTDFPKEDIVRATNGMFLRISTDTAGNPYLEWSLTGTDNWHSVSDTAVEALSKINNHLADKNNPHETAISKLTDVELTNLSANQFLSFNGIKWVNVAYNTTVRWGGIFGSILDQADLMNMFVQKAGDTMSGALNIEDIASSNAPLLTLTHSNTATYKWNIAPRYNSTTLSIYPGSTETNGFRFATTGFVPASNNARYLGSASLKWKGVYTAMLNNGGDLVVPAVSGTIATKADVDLAANSGRMITDQGVWYAKMYAATVAPSAEDGTNYADFSQTDGQGNPIIVIYERQNGAWVQDQTITPPADYDGYVSITSKIWDIVEQAGQQGGRILWNHQSKEFTPYPQIISFEDAALTGTSTAPTPTNSSPNDQIANKEYVDNATSSNGYHPELLSHEWDDHERNNMSWVNALTFSWQDSSFYEAAYDHLVDDITTTTLLPYVTLNGNNYYRTPSFDEPGQNHPYAYVYNNHSGTIDIKYSDISTGAISETYWPSATATTGGIVADDGGQEYIPAKQYETISGVTIGYYVTSDGHKIVDAADENLVASIYTATGIAWYYILDETNQRFKLPRSRFQVDTTKLIKSLDNSNKTAISFPYTATEDGYVGVCLKYVDGTIGSISVNNIVVFNNTTKYNGSYLIGFESVGIYVKKGDIITISGFSNDTSYFMPYETVTTDQRLYFYVGNYTQTAIENTAGLNASLFNNKADLDLANVLSNIDFVVDSQLPTAANNYTWYRKYKSGWVEQGGKGVTSLTIVLPVPMADDNYFITTGNNYYSASAGTPVVVWYDKTSTGFTLQGRWNGSGVNDIDCCWQVSGIAAS